MAITTSLAQTELIIDNDGGDGGREGMIKIERIEHLGGEVDFFIDCRDWQGEGPQLSLSPVSAQALHAWFGKQLGK